MYVGVVHGCTVKLEFACESSVTLCELLVRAKPKTGELVRHRTNVMLRDEPLKAGSLR